MKSELKNIMLIEDDVDIQEIAKLALCSIGGFTVTVCSSGEDALKIIKDANPQLILLDVMMPNMDGPTTFKKLKTMPEADEIPVIFMTAKVQPQEIATYKKLGVLDVISKPFDPMTLSERLQSIWRAEK